MGLSTFAPKTEMVELPNGVTFAVRGLALEDITVLLRDHYEPIRVLFEKYVTAGAESALAKTLNEQEATDNLDRIILEVLQAAPSLIGDVIAQAADEPGFSHIARRLPLGAQIDAIDKTIRLTLEAEGGMEKLVETVSRLAGSLTDLTASLST